MPLKLKAPTGEKLPILVGSLVKLKVPQKKKIFASGSAIMSRFYQLDIVIELSELCQDLMREIRQQLNYYRASVYKSETARHINYRVEKLRMVAKLMRDEVFIEAFRDFDAMKELGASACVAGECSFSTRTSRLLQAFDKRCEFIVQQANNRNTEFISSTLMKDVQRHRRELLSMCRQGTRHWVFFQSM